MESVVYAYAIPALVLGQNLAIYLWSGAPSWWLNGCRATLGI